MMDEAELDEFGYEIGDEGRLGKLKKDLWFSIDGIGQSVVNKEGKTTKDRDFVVGLTSKGEQLDPKEVENCLKDVLRFLKRDDDTEMWVHLWCNKLLLVRNRLVPLVRSLGGHEDDIKLFYQVVRILVELTVSPESGHPRRHELLQALRETKRELLDPRVFRTMNKQILHAFATLEKSPPADDADQQPSPDQQQQEQQEQEQQQQQPPDAAADGAAADGATTEEIAKKKAEEERKKREIQKQKAKARKKREQDNGRAKSIILFSIGLLRNLGKIPDPMPVQGILSDMNSKLTIRLLGLWVEEGVLEQLQDFFLQRTDSDEQKLRCYNYVFCGDDGDLQERLYYLLHEFYCYALTSIDVQSIFNALEQWERSPLSGRKDGDANRGRERGRGDRSDAASVAASIAPSTVLHASSTRPRFRKPPPKAPEIPFGIRIAHESKQKTLQDAMEKQFQEERERVKQTRPKDPENHYPFPLPPGQYLKDDVDEGELRKWLEEVYPQRVEMVQERRAGSEPAFPWPIPPDQYVRRDKEGHLRDWMEVKYKETLQTRQMDPAGVYPDPEPPKKLLPDLNIKPQKESTLLTDKITRRIQQTYRSRKAEDILFVDMRYRNPVDLLEFFSGKTVKKLYDTIAQFIEAEYSHVAGFVFRELDKYKEIVDLGEMKDMDGRHLEITERDEAHLFNLATFVLQFFRLNHQRKMAELRKNDPELVLNPNDPAQKIDLTLLQQAADPPFFTYTVARLKAYGSRGKRCTRVMPRHNELRFVLRCFVEQIRFLKMLKGIDRSPAVVYLRHIFKEAAVHAEHGYILREFVPTKHHPEVLQLALLAEHMLLDMLEEIQKETGGQKMEVHQWRKKASSKKKVAFLAGSNDDDDEDEEDPYHHQQHMEGAPNAPQQEEGQANQRKFRNASGEEVTMVRCKSKYVGMDDALAELCDTRIVNNLFHMVRMWKQHDSELIEVITNLISRIIKNNPNNIVMFFQCGIFLTIQRLINDPNRPQRLSIVCEYIVKSFFKVAETNPLGAHAGRAYDQHIRDELRNIRENYEPSIQMYRDIANELKHPRGPGGGGDEGEEEPAVEMDVERDEADLDALAKKRQEIAKRKKAAKGFIEADDPVLRKLFEERKHEIEEMGENQWLQTIADRFPGRNITAKKVYGRFVKLGLLKKKKERKNDAPSSDDDNAKRLAGEDNEEDPDKDQGWRNPKWRRPLLQGVYELKRHAADFSEAPETVIEIKLDKELSGWLAFRADRQKEIHELRERTKEEEKKERPNQELIQVLDERIEAQMKDLEAMREFPIQLDEEYREEFHASADFCLLLRALGAREPTDDAEEGGENIFWTFLSAQPVSNLKKRLQKLKHYLELSEEDLEDRLHGRRRRQRDEEEQEGDQQQRRSDGEEEEEDDYDGEQDIFRRRRPQPRDMPDPFAAYADPPAGEEHAEGDADDESDGGDEAVQAFKQLLYKTVLEVDASAAVDSGIDRDLIRDICDDIDRWREGAEENREGGIDVEDFRIEAPGLHAEDCLGHPLVGRILEALGATEQDSEWTMDRNTDLNELRSRLSIIKKALIQDTEVLERRVKGPRGGEDERMDDDAGDGEEEAGREERRKRKKKDKKKKEKAKKKKEKKKEKKKRHQQQDQQEEASQPEERGGEEADAEDDDMPLEQEQEQQEEEDDYRPGQDIFNRGRADDNEREAAHDDIIEEEEEQPPAAPPPAEADDIIEEEEEQQPAPFPPPAPPAVDEMPPPPAQVMVAPPGPPVDESATVRPPVDDSATVRERQDTTGEETEAPVPPPAANQPDEAPAGAADGAGEQMEDDIDEEVRQMEEDPAAAALFEEVLGGDDADFESRPQTQTQRASRKRRTGGAIPSNKRPRRSAASPQRPQAVPEVKLEAMVSQMLKEEPDEDEGGPGPAAPPAGVVTKQEPQDD
ncbi:unnamed protein product [Vitrella brassicaformis CCMP3155]|uniref:Timeless N-terminal domain-containing protein n=2 Tax=Vitrella brassicaformis TaxID=1169539 RepID=A0A0G4F954_VITBC|nr:unnamed protein product [Vitrella brassicaformis CCMP3155]|eukprot:CEM09137.1 unnamed protein product [Vitrella brassicaformis CCMP3155]